jgi:hypothetical protein
MPDDTILAALDRIETDARSTTSGHDPMDGRWYTAAEFANEIGLPDAQHIANASPTVVIALVQVARAAEAWDADSGVGYVTRAGLEAAITALRETLGAGE